MTDGIFLALGSNAGDRRAHLNAACVHLRRRALSVTAMSPVYETPAHTWTPEEIQPPYLNLVMAIDTALDPLALLDVCQEVEGAGGRVRLAGKPWAPRTIDVDVLAYHQQTRAGDRLTLPHPRLAGRRFVLEPWAQVAPQFHVPAPFDASVHALLSTCADTSRLTRVASLP